METINISNAKSENEHKMFKGDGLRLVFLTLLYSIQGFGFGFLDMTMPVILKKHFTYSEIGIISWWCLSLVDIIPLSSGGGIVFWKKIS